MKASMDSVQNDDIKMDFYDYESTDKLNSWQIPSTHNNKQFIFFSY